MNKSDIELVSETVAEKEAVPELDIVSDNNRESDLSKAESTEIDKPSD